MEQAWFDSLESAILKGIRIGYRTNETIYYTKKLNIGQSSTLYSLQRNNLSIHYKTVCYDEVPYPIICHSGFLLLTISYKDQIYEVICDQITREEGLLYKSDYHRGYGMIISDTKYTRDYSDDEVLRINEEAKIYEPYDHSLEHFDKTNNNGAFAHALLILVEKSKDAKILSIEPCILPKEATKIHSRRSSYLLSINELEISVKDKQILLYNEIIEKGPSHSDHDGGYERAVDRSRIKGVVEFPTNYSRDQELQRLEQTYVIKQRDNKKYIVLPKDIKPQIDAVKAFGGVWETESDWWTEYCDYGD